MRAVLHIGTEKTGTTSIQRMLDANRRALVRQGFYVAHFYGGSNNKDWPAWCLRDEQDDDFFHLHLATTMEQRRDYKAWLLEQFTDELQAIPAHCHTLILSSEHFHSRLLHQDELWRLRGLLARACSEFRILVYLRRQVDMATSYYGTTLQNGQLRGPHAVVCEECRPENPYYDFHGLLARWAGVFGRRNVIPRLFDPAEFTGGGLLDDFTAQLGPGLDTTALNLDLPRQHESVDLFGQSLFRAINRHVPFLLPKVGINPLYSRLKMHIRASSAGNAAVLDPETAARVQARFDATNELVRREYFPARPRLFQPGPPKLPEPVLTSEQEQLLAEVVGMLAGDGKKG